MTIPRSSVVGLSGLIAVGLVAGLIGGLVGGATATLIDSDNEGSTPETTTTPTVEPDATTGTVDTLARLQDAIDAVLPAVVTVVADAPTRLDEDGNEVQTRSLGSGIVISDSGHIVTNFHVVEGAATLTVVLSNGEERTAQLIGDDAPFTDVAVLRVAPQGLRSLRFGDSTALRQGETVAAISGRSFVGGNSVRVGAVSGLERRWPRDGVILEDLVQTDVGVNSGDSGSALVTAEGELVGLITTVVQATQDGQPVQGVAFAQSSRSIESAVASIITTGSVPRPRLGIERARVGHLELSPELAEDRGLSTPFGALVINVPAGSPADDAGIQMGDVVVAVGGVRVDFDRPFVNLLKALSPGSVAELLVLRDGAELSISATTSPR